MKQYIVILFLVYLQTLCGKSEFPAISDLHEKLLKTKRSETSEKVSFTGKSYTFPLRKIIIDDYETKIESQNSSKIIMIERYSILGSDVSELHNTFVSDKFLFTYVMKINKGEKQVKYKWQQFKLKEDELKEIRRLADATKYLIGNCTTPSTTQFPSFITVWENDHIKNFFVAGTIIRKHVYQYHRGADYFDDVKEAFDVINYLDGIILDNVRDREILKEGTFPYDTENLPSVVKPE